RVPRLATFHRPPWPRRPADHPPATVSLSLSTIPPRGSRRRGRTPPQGAAVSICGPALESAEPSPLRSFPSLGRGRQAVAGRIVTAPHRRGLLLMAGAAGVALASPRRLLATPPA